MAADAISLATLVVNMIGCFVIGLLAGLVVSDRIVLRFHWREFLIVGVLGGFTTFSTFGLDTLTLIRAHSSDAALWNVAAHIGAGLMAVHAGMLIGTRV